jgi:hypothetical protein
LQVGNPAQQETDMKFGWIVFGPAAFAAAISLIAAGPANARPKHHPKFHKSVCEDRLQRFSWYGFFFNPAPQPNGCAPPVYAYGKYVGQDPDPFIRHQLERDPRTGYWPF